MAAPAIIAAERAANPNKDAIIAALLGEVVLFIGPDVDPETYDPRDAVTGAIAGVVGWHEQFYWLDEDDGTTDHDGLTCLVLVGGFRYKIGGTLNPSAVLSRTVATPPDPDDVDPEARPDYGDSYLVPTGATGEWATHVDDRATWTARGWSYTPAGYGSPVYVVDEDVLIRWTEAGEWVTGATPGDFAAGSIPPSALIGGGGRTFWQVENQTTNAPPAVVNGTAYVIGSAPTGAWAGHTGKIAHGENSAWVIYAPAEGWRIYDKALNANRQYDGAAWIATDAATVLIDVKTVTSAQATVDLTTGFNDTFDKYELHIHGLRTVNDDVALWMRVGVGGPVSYPSGVADYRHQRLELGNSTSAAAGGTDSKIAMTNAGGGGLGIGNAAGECLHGTIEFANPESVVDFVQYFFDLHYAAANGTLCDMRGSGRYSTVGAQVALRFLASSGNIAAGVFVLIGIKKA